MKRINLNKHDVTKGVFLLVFILLCNLGVSAQTSFTIGSLNYITTSNTTVSVSKNGTPTGELSIPASVIYKGKQYSVTSIREYAFLNCSGLKYVIIPSSVTSIESHAFNGCSGLTSVIIGNSVTSIGSCAFLDCKGLTSITIPNSVKSIGNGAFQSCSSLTSIDIPNSVTSIGDYAFDDCSSLTSIDIPNSVTKIGGAAFYKCSRLKSVTIPNSVTSIEGSTFYGCIRLTSVTIPNSVTSIGSYAFWSCFYLTSIDIPNSVTSIGDYAFDDCSDLVSVTIPSSVTTIGKQAFWDCSSLTSVTINSNAILSKTYSSESSLKDIFGSQVKKYKIGNSVEKIGNYAFYHCSDLVSVTIPNSVTSIGKYAFWGCNGLTSIDIPNSVTSIGNSAFSGCSGLTSIDIPNSVTSIGNSAFFRCSGLIDIYCHIEEPLTISSDVFTEAPKNSCTLHVPIGSKSKYEAADVWKDFLNIVEDLMKEKISQTITWNTSQTTLLVDDEIELAAVASSALPVTYTIKSGNDCGTLIVNGEKTFLKGTKKGKIVIEAKQAGNEDYHSVTTQKEFIVTDNILPIGTEFTVEKIVYRITSDTEVKVVGHNEISGDVIIPDKVNYPGSEQRYSVKDIGERAFYDCTGMTSLTIPSSVKQIGRQAFRGCTGMTELILADGVETIGYAAFELCTSLTSVHIPNSVTYIDAWAFTACYGLKTVLIPNNVTAINHSAFNRCNELEDIYCYIEEPLTVIDSTFEGVPKGQSGCKLHVPIGSGDAYRNADVWKEFYIVEDLTTGIVSIDNSQLTIDNDVWYTLSGVRLNGKPTKAGVYIVNGTKVVIK